MVINRNGNILMQINNDYFVRTFHFDQQVLVAEPQKYVVQYKCKKRAC